MRYLLYKIIIIFAISQSVFANDFVYFIDTDLIVQQTKEYNNIKNQLNKEFKPFFDEIQIKADKIKSERTQLSMSDIFLKNVKSEKELNLDKQTFELEAKIAIINNKYRVKEESLKVLIIKKIIIKAKEYSEKNNINILLEKNSIVIFKKGSYKDISKEILTTIDF